MIVLRPYQETGINQIATKAGQGKKRIIFQLATGGGKTVTFAGLVQRYLQRQNRKVLILVHRSELLQQAIKTLYRGYEIIAAPVTAETSYLPNVPVYVAMVETANNRLKKNENYFGNVGLVIVDECHIGNFKKLYDYFSSALIIGFTATPISGSKKDPLKNHFEDIVCGIDIPELIASGSLVKNKTYHLKNIDRDELKIKNGEFDERQMGSVFSSSKHVQNCIAAYQKFALGTKTIVFNCNIEHSKKVTDTFRSFGYDARHLDGEAPEQIRKLTLEWFKNTSDAILCNVGILTTGFDEPSVRTVIVNKSTMSLPLWLQMTGRGSRPHPGKEHFTIVDMGGNAMYHGDWCQSRNWADIFFHPEKPKEGGEAPTKECVGCGVLIHLSQKVCHHCGALNTKPVEYDKDLVKFELLLQNKPPEINVARLIEESRDRKDYYSLHYVKLELIKHVCRNWNLKKLDDKTAGKLHGIFQEKVREWCKLKGKHYNTWHRETSAQWLNEELKRVFKYEPEALRA